MPEVKEVDVECCGQHEVCERDSLLAAVSKKIEYYDDGELEQAKSKLKNFMDKVEKVVAKAQKALDESQNAISELEASTKVVEKRLLSGDLDEKTKKEMESYVDESEDLTISSLEEIAGTKEMLSKFKEKLNEINQKIG
jgi:phenylalanyl-tRNA synthetase alpha subunit